MSPGASQSIATGRDNAPVAVYNDEPARDGWADILALAERIVPTNSLIPDDFDQRTRMFGLCHAICSPGGFGWNRRTLLLAPMYAEGMPDAAKEIDELDLSVRSANCLKNANINTLRELVRKSEKEMLETKNFGRKSLEELQELLGKLGLGFGMNVPEATVVEASPQA